MPSIMATESLGSIITVDHNGQGYGRPTAPYILARRVPKKTRACVPCHERKVKCNATQSGLPCTRCIVQCRVEECILVPHRTPGCGGLDRRTPGHGLTVDRASKRKRIIASENPTDRNALPRQHPVPDQPGSDSGIRSVRFDRPRDTSSSLSAETECSDHNSRPVREPVSDGEMRREAPNQSSPVVEEEDADLQVCREIFQKGNDTLSPAPAGRLDGGREIIEFHDGIDSITILGEVFGQKQPSRLVRIVLKNPNPSTGDPGERAGLDALDLEYLRRKGAFTLPPCETRCVFSTRLAHRFDGAIATRSSACTSNASIHMPRSSTGSNL